MENFFILDFPPLLASLFTAISCALIGSFLVLRKESLLADAISHSVLPGIVLAFYFVGSRQGFGILIGALIAAITSSILIRLLRQYGRMENGAATGVVFSIYFALGIVLLEKLSASSVDLDVDCVLHGQLETIFWAIPSNIPIFSFESLKYFPPEVFQSILTAFTVCLFISIFYKELLLSSFDSAFSKVTGNHVLLLDSLFLAIVGLVVVSAFNIVGSILVIAMFICPAASSRMFADDLPMQLKLSCVFATISSLVGYFVGAFLPLTLGFSNSIAVSGLISVVSGIVLILSILFAPKYGVIGRRIRKNRQKMEILTDDILGYIYRKVEGDNNYASVSLDSFSLNKIQQKSYDVAINKLIREDCLIRKGQLFELTKNGLDVAKSIIKKHRLIEAYLVDNAGIKEDHVHQSAEELEHLISSSLEHYLETKVPNEFDPHGKPIPK